MALGQTATGAAGVVLDRGRRAAAFGRARLLPQAQRTAARSGLRMPPSKRKRGRTLQRQRSERVRTKFCPRLRDGRQSANVARRHRESQQAVPAVGCARNLAWCCAICSESHAQEPARGTRPCRQPPGCAVYHPERRWSGVDARQQPLTNTRALPRRSRSPFENTQIQLLQRAARRLPLPRHDFIGCAYRVAGATSTDCGHALLPVGLDCSEPPPPCAAEQCATRRKSTKSVG